MSEAMISDLPAYASIRKMIRRGKVVDSLFQVLGAP